MKTPYLFVAISIVVAFSWSQTQTQFSVTPVHAGLPAGVLGYEPVAADVDGDGDEDVILFYNEEGNADVSLLRNRGDGEFDATRIAFTVEAYALRATDVDGDGDFDLLLGHRLGMTLYMNDGSGAFAVGINRLPQVGSPVTSIEVADTDGDGSVEILPVHANSPLLFRNDGTGHFADVTGAALPANGLANVVDIEAGDVDGDGDRDLILSQLASVHAGLAERQDRVYLNDGTGQFTDGTVGRVPMDIDYTIDSALVDVDGDGDLDWAAVRRHPVQLAGVPARLYLNDGQGVFTPAASSSLPPANFQGESIIPGDSDGDGDADLLITGGGVGNNIGNRLFLNDGTGTFSRASEAVFESFGELTVGGAYSDVDRDGDVDILVGNVAYPLLYLNDGQGNFRNTCVHRIEPTRIQGWGVGIFDANGDGFPDVARGDEVHFGDGTGFFQRGWGQRGNQPRSFDYGDVDSDGDIDLVYGGASGTRPWVGRNNGTGSFAPFQIFGPGVLRATTNDVDLADLDGDGDLDLHLSNTEANNLFFNDGAGNFSDQNVRMPSTVRETRKAAVADFDGDGDPDIVTANIGGHRILINDGSGNFTDETHLRFMYLSSAICMATGDIDADGDVDLYFSERRHFSHLYINDGSGYFTDESTRIQHPRHSESHAAEFVDMDSDGDLDLVTLEKFGSPQIRLNDGAGYFGQNISERISYPLGEPLYSLAIGDLDLDGDLDLVVGSANDAMRRPTRICTNAARQQVSGHLVQVGGAIRYDFLHEPGFATAPRVIAPLMAFGRLPAPVPTPIGMLLADASSLFALPTLNIPQMQSSATLRLALPANPATAGLELVLQSVILDPSNPLDMHLMNPTSNYISP